MISKVKKPFRLVAVILTGLLLFLGVGILRSDYFDPPPERHVSALPFPGLEELSQRSDAVVIAEFVGAGRTTEVRLGPEDEGYLEGHDEGDVYQRLQFRVIEPMHGVHQEGEIVEVTVLSGIIAGDKTEFINDHRYETFQNSAGKYVLTGKAEGEQFVLFLNKNSLVADTFNSPVWGIPQLKDDKEFTFPHEGHGRVHTKFEINALRESVHKVDRSVDSGFEGNKEDNDG